MKSIESEKRVIGSLFLQPELLPDVQVIVQPKDFDNRTCQWIYQNMLDAHEIGEAFTPEILLSKVADEDYGKFVDFLDALLDQTPTADNAHYFAGKVKEAAMKRRLDAELSYDVDSDPAKLKAILEEMSEFKKPKERRKHTANELMLELERKLKTEKGKGLDPGFDFLKKATRRMMPGMLWIVGGYTGVGKSAFLVELIMRLFENNPKSGGIVFSIEMGFDSYFLRMYSNYTGIPIWDLQDHMDTYESEVSKARQFIGSHKFDLFEDVYTWEEIKSESKKLCFGGGYDFIAIDFIQNLIGRGSIYERMSFLAPQMQALAKDLNVTIIAFSQIPDEAITGDSFAIKYKGAGEIAAAADLGLWLTSDKDNRHRINVGVRKNRHGPTGKAVLYFNENWTQIKESA
jgi:replicative DNA helicase